MKSKTFPNHVLNTILVLVLFASSGFPALALNLNTNPITETSQAQWIVAQVYFSGTDELNQLASYLDIWEVNQDKSYLIAMLSPDQFASLVQAGYKVVIDDSKTASLNQPLAFLPDQSTDTIPSYSCYRTVEETYSSMDNLAISYPNLVDVFKIGNSWDKVTPGGPAGYDIKVMRLSNEKFGVIGQKPTFFLMAEIHAREYVTAETAMRFAEYMVSNYHLDPDITWLLDYYRIYIVTMTNPGGRKFAEQGIMWRKNTNDVAGGGCSYPYYGVDLNRKPYIQMESWWF